MKNRIMLGVLAVLLSGFVVISNAQTTASEESSVTLINPFEVPADKFDATVSMWEQARDFLKQQPGYISTQLHQSL
ncbi:MAG: antibiotic biosynthesis monooxygenase family protein, partial [Thiolinea sp.]